MAKEIKKFKTYKKLDYASTKRVYARVEVERTTREQVFEYLKMGVTISR